MVRVHLHQGHGLRVGLGLTSCATMDFKWQADLLWKRLLGVMGGYGPSSMGRQSLDSSP